MPLAVITGTSQGIGKSIALEFISNGWTVVGCARDTEAMSLLSKQYPKHYFTPVDISNFYSVQTWINTIIYKYGIPDIIINNASIFNPKQFELKSIPEHHKTMNINLFGTIYVNYCLIPYLKQSKKNNIKILNLSSSSAIKGFGNNTTYCMSKFAIDGFTKSLANELTENIMVCGYDPGIVITRMMLLSGTKEELLKRGAIDVNIWGKLNFDFIVNKLNRNEHNGKHVFGINAIQSYIDYGELTKQEVEKYQEFSKL